jgi:K+-sensing histidine kinase KdpD
MRHTRSWRLLKALGGIAICAAAAAVLTASFRGRNSAEIVPVLFVIVALIVARFVSSAGAMLGNFAAALIFATFLFQPIGNTAIGENAARENLLLMLTLGVPASYFIGRAWPQTKSGGKID